MSFRNDRRRHADDEMDVDQKRRRGPETHSDLEQRVVQLIVQIGDKPGAGGVETHIEKLVTLLEAELDKIGPRIISCVCECAKHLPDKLTIYSTLVGLLNAKNYNFGGEIVEKLVADLQSTLEGGSFKHALNLVTFMCDLGNCRVLSLSSVVEFLEGLLEAAAEEGAPQVRTDWFVFAILRSLPWIGGELKNKKTEELENLLGGVTQYMEQRSTAHAKVLGAWEEGEKGGLEQEEYLVCLYEQIKLLAGCGWQEKHIPRLYSHFEGPLADALQHNLPTVAPPPHTSETRYPLPYVVFRLFDYTDCPEDGPTLPGAHSIERYLIEDELGWIIDLNEMNRRDCAEALLNYTHKANVPLPYVVLETIFGRLFALPESPQPRLFYGALLIELCRLQPSSFPQVLAQAAELLYDRSQFMQPACLDRFIDWFSYHLSNFQYKWSWQDWNDCLEADALDHKFVLAREVLEKCMRFSFYDRMVEILPETHSKLLPAKPEIFYPFDDENHEENERARHYQGLFQQKLAPEDMIEELRTVVEDGEEAVVDPRSFAVWFAVLLKLASKSFSHNFAALARYHKTLKEIVPSSEMMQGELLNTLLGCWRDNSQMLLILVDKLIKMKIIRPSALVEWMFEEEEVKSRHNRLWVWEMLNNALDKNTKEVSKLRKELEGIRKAKAGADKKRQEQGEEEKNDEDEMMEGEQDMAEASKEAEVNKESNDLRNVFSETLAKMCVAVSDAGEGEELRCKWILGRMKQLYIQHWEVVVEILPHLEETIFSRPDIDQRARMIFKSVCALRA